MTSSLATFIALLAFLPQSDAATNDHQYQPAPLSGVPARRLNAYGDGDLRLHEATFIASHNAHATLAAAADDFFLPLGTNQEDAILDQLTNDGVRALLIDIALDNENEEDPLRLVHAYEPAQITLDYGGVRSGFADNLIPFLEENPEAIISFFVETRNDTGDNSAFVRANILEQLWDVFSSMTVNGVSLKDMTFKYDDEQWKDHDNWPTLDEIRQSGQRIFFFSNRSEYIDPEFGFMYNQHVLSENDWEGIDDCEPRYMWRSGKVSLPSNNQWTRLFFMNHFCCGGGPGSIGDTIGDNLIGGGNNGWGKLYTRVQQCMANNGGFKPNFIALDWVKQSIEAKEIRDYLQFGGRLGTGQACTEDSHCATSSCNVALGVCECQQCNIDSLDGCPGCESGQFCSSPGGEELNFCEGEEGTEQITFEPSIPGGGIALVGGGSGAQQLNSTGGAPSLSPTGAETTFYCGEDYFAAVANCMLAVKCPGGNDDCPVGQTCFAGIVGCTSSPTPFSSDLPSMSPSTAVPTLVIAGFFAPSYTAPSVITQAADDTSFCGISYESTKANCQNALPCTGPDDNSKCSVLGAEYACFSNIVCVSDTLPTITIQDQNPSPTQQISPSGTDWLSTLGLTNSPAGSATSPPEIAAAPTRSPSSMPTETPFDFSNEFYCGANYTDAVENCYNINRPCPTRQPSVCGEGGTCFSGIACTAPPSATPTAIMPTKPPTSSDGLASNGIPNGRPNALPNGMPSDTSSSQFGTGAPFDSQLYENKSGAVSFTSGSMIGKIARSAVVAIGLIGFLFY